MQWSDWGTNYSNGTSGNVSNNGTFIFYGRKFTNSGKYSSSAGSKDSFISATIDTIAGTFRPRFYDVVFNNGSNNFAITNDSGIYVAHNINLASSIVSTVRSDSSTGALTLADNATYTGAMSNTKHVNGYVTKIGNDAFIFPTGHSGKYHPFTISAPSSTSSALSVAYYYSNPATTDPTGGSHPLTNLATGLTSVDNSQFWDVVTVQSPMIVDVTINFESIANQYHNTLTTRMVGWNVTTAKWEIIGTAMPNYLTNNGTITNSSVDLSRYSALGIGNTIEVLPVELVSFTAQKNNDNQSLLQWETASETNNDKFIVERSADLISFTEIGEQAGAGNSHVTHDYSLIDAQPLNGINYYRLKQMNFDGTYEYSKIVSLTFDNMMSANDDVQVELLNSINEPSLKITIPADFSNTNFVLEIYNEAGQIVKQSEQFSVDGGSYSIKSLGLGFAEHGFYVAVLSNITQKRKRTFKVIR